MDLTIPHETVEHVCEGETFKFEGKRYRLERKRSTAVAVTRYYWWDALYDYLTRKEGN